MPPVATVVPAETDILCEGCGYTLNGLPETGNCPECGKPIAQSLGGHRKLSEFEIRPSLRTFLVTSAAVIFQPRAFYSNLTTRGTTRPAKLFVGVHCAIGATLFTVAIVGHTFWLAEMFTPANFRLNLVALSVILLVAPVFTFVTLALLARLAGWLSAIEARYWGMRLPYPVVMRGLTFHSAHHLPVGLLAIAIVWGYRLLLDQQILDRTHGWIYLYTLCGAVIVSAVYLFYTYWIAMKNMMYANR